MLSGGARGTLQNLSLLNEHFPSLTLRKSDTREDMSIFPSVDHPATERDNPPGQVRRRDFIKTKKGRLKRRRLKETDLDLLQVRITPVKGFVKGLCENFKYT